MHLLPAEAIRVALEDAPDAMLIVDREGTIRFANESVRVLFGHPHDELVGENLELLIPERFRAGHVRYREQFAKNPIPRGMGGQRLDLYGLRADGSEFPAEISLKAIRCEPEWFTVAAIRDLTGRAALERELREARSQAEHADLAKSRFLATASHDLRQPIQTLALLNGTLRRVVTDRPEALEVLTAQGHAIESMSRLVNALLDISKLESGAVKPEARDFSVNTLFEELSSEYASLADSKGLRLKVTQSEEAAHSDPALVGQILRNLISNAVRYTRQGWVALRCLRESAALVRIEVLDTGVGIAPDQLSHIYEEFFQVGGPHNRAREGYGLGLSIVRRLVTLLGLKLDVQSDVGRGSLFALTLPASHGTVTAESRIKVPPPLESASIPAHILLVEDDAGVRNATRMLLETEGYRVKAVASEADALEHARNDASIDLLVSDYHLGDGELGTQVIARVREVLQRPLKAVLMTGDTSSAMNRLPADPLTKLASKPVDAEELLTLLRTMLAAD
jgi:two-component system, sensor histidine kinase